MFLWSLTSYMINILCIILLLLILYHFVIGEERIESYRNDLTPNMPNSTVEMALDSSKNNIPEVYVNENMARPMNSHLFIMEYKERSKYYDKVYEINGSIFREDLKEAEDNEVLTAFELHTNGKPNLTIFESIDVYLRVSIQVTSNGVIINSKVLLTLEQWNTVVEDNSSHKCIVCDSLICDANVHVEMDDHKEILAKYQPLKDFDLSITRLIGNIYHCGVCNESVDRNKVSEHFDGKSHEEKMLLATKRASDVMSDSEKNADSAKIDQNKKENGNNNKNYHHVDRKRTLINSDEAGAFTQDGFVAKLKEEESDVNQISYASIAKKTIATPEYLYVPAFNNVIRMKYDHWHMVITFKNQKHYCMICKKHLAAAAKGTHCAEPGHLGRLNSLTFIKDHPRCYIRQIDGSYYHCGLCNDLHFILDINSHVHNKHSKAIVNQFLELFHVDKNELENLRKPDGTLNLQDPMNIAKSNSVVADTQTSNVNTTIQNMNNENRMQPYTNDNKNVRNENNDNVAIVKWCNNNKIECTDVEKIEYEINNECPSIYNDVLITQFNFRVRVSFISYNLVCRTLNGYYCHVCGESACAADMKCHIKESCHVLRLRRVPFQNNCGINLIRMVGLKSHCAICNVTFNVETTKNHVFDGNHVKLLNKALEFANITHSVFNAPINELNQLPMNPNPMGMNHWSVPRPIMSPLVILKQWQMPQQPIQMHQMPIIQPTLAINQWPTLPPPRSEQPWLAAPRMDSNRPAMNRMQVNTNQPTMTPKMNSPKSAMNQPKITKPKTNMNQLGRTVPKSDMHQIKNDENLPKIVMNQPTISQPKTSIDQHTTNVPKSDMDESKNDMNPKIVTNEPNITVPKSDVDESKNYMNPKIVMNEPNITVPKSDMDESKNDMNPKIVTNEPNITVPKSDMDESKNDMNPKIVMNEPNITVPKSDMDESKNDKNPKIVTNEPNITVPKSDMNQLKIDLTKRDDSTTTLNINEANHQITIDPEKDLNKTTISQPKRNVNLRTISEPTFNLDDPKSDINPTEIVMNQPTVVQSDTNINLCTVSKFDVDQPKNDMNPPKIDLNECKGSMTTLPVNEAKTNEDRGVTREIDENHQTSTDPQIDVNKASISQPKTNTNQHTISLPKLDMDEHKNDMIPPKIDLNKRKDSTTTNINKAKPNVDQHTSSQTEINKNNQTFIDPKIDMNKPTNSQPKTNINQRTISVPKTDMDKPKNGMKPPKMGLNKRKSTSTNINKGDMGLHTTSQTEIVKNNQTFIDPVTDGNKPKTETNQPKTDDKQTESTVDILDPNEAIRNAVEDFEYFNEKFVYLKFKNNVIQVSLLSYNGLVNTGGGVRYCFVCSVHVYSSLKTHVESANHTKCIDECKFVRKYDKHFLRQILSNYHCIVCNIILTGNDISKHIIWSLHVPDNKTDKKIRRAKIKAGSKIQIITFQNETIQNNGEDDEIKVLVKCVISPNALCVEATQKKNKIITYRDKNFKITWDLYHGLVKHKSGNRCLLCASDVRAYEVSAHIAGECHKSKVDKFETRRLPHLIRKVNDSALNCVVCNIEVANREHIVTEHVCSKKHKRNFDAMLMDSSSLEGYSDCVINLSFN